MDVTPITDPDPFVSQPAWEVAYLFPSQGDWVYRVAFTPDAAELAAGTFTGTVALFETATGKLVATLSTSR